MRAQTAVLALLLAPSLAQAAFRTAWPVDGRIGVVNSNSPARSAEDNLKSTGAEIDLHFSPILGWTQSRWLILPAADIAFNSTNTILKVDDERFEFLQQLTSRGELGVAFKRTPDQRFGGRVFVEGFQAKQAVNEELLFGQYNYQDSGLGLDWREKWSLMRTTLGATFTDRRYPHWQTLDDTKRSEKDEAIAKGFVDLEWPWASVNGVTKLGVSYQAANYYAGLTVDETGTTLNAVKRRDNVINANLAVPMRFGGSDVDLSIGVQSWDSNLNHFDTQTGTYIPEYNDFVDVYGGIGYAYGFRRPWWFLKSPQLSLDIDLELRQYGQRLAKAADGSFQDAKQRDFTRNITVGFNSSISEHWAFYLRANQLSAASNNEDSSSALYNYTFNTFGAGVNFVY